MLAPKKSFLFSIELREIYRQKVKYQIRIHNFGKNIFGSIVEEFAKVSNRSVIELESNGEKLVPPTFSLQILQILLDL